MKIHETLEQGSLEWCEIRAGKVTASEFGSIVTNKFKARDGEMVQTYIAEKCAEYWQGGPLPSFSSFATEQGSLLENMDAVPWYELEYNCAVQRVGFIEHDTLPCGCSPDGIVDGKRGVEVKCLQAAKHVKGLLAGTVPEDFLPQIHFSLYVTSFERWTFLQYRRGFPNLVVTVERDEEIQEKIHDALTDFLVRLDTAKARMIELNGGLPPRLTPLTPIAPRDTKPKSPAPELNEIGVTP